jgi:glycosyltransferase involved in cell wall biosynthesis
VPDISVCVPFVGEYPQVEFTIRSVAEELGHFCDFEILAIDNWCDQVEQQGREPDEDHDRVLFLHTIAEDMFQLWHGVIAEEIAQHGESRVGQILKEQLSQLSYEIIEKRAASWEPDQGHQHTNKDGKLVMGAIQSWSRKHPWLKHVRYDEKLSHWNAKRVGVEASSSPVLLFLDAHVIPSRDAFLAQYRWFEVLQKTEGPDITLHLPLTYHILENHRLIYRLVDERETGNIAYSFCGYRESAQPYEVPCMSTCGMMMTRKLYDKLGGWPRELGIYSGGEHWLNWTGATCGVRKFIVPNRTLHHHGAKRAYHYTYDDALRNRAIANYLFGGEEYLDRYIKYKKGRDAVKAFIRDDVLKSCAEHRELIKAQQVCTIDEWLDRQKQT